MTPDMIAMIQKTQDNATELYKYGKEIMGLDPVDLTIALSVTLGKAVANTPCPPLGSEAKSLEVTAELFVFEYYKEKLRLSLV